MLKAPQGWWVAAVKWNFAADHAIMSSIIVSLGSVWHNLEKLEIELMSDYVLCKTVEPFRNSNQISHGLYPQERLLRLLLNLASCKNVDKSSIPNTAGNSMLNSTEAGRKCWPLLLRHFCTLMVISFLERDWKTAAGAVKGWGKSRFVAESLLQCISCSWLLPVGALLASWDGLTK